ncbi:peptide-methionine (S)-S-oxide reductase [Malassezia vespertilionis]|uniref:peptide-methionine (S)-S-oxide reductase n=1 Tax=Malassezia vespertilionis TaxID=2020962 RepID=A0A2N1JGJ6_9BASI|nr:peptide-methionine (S)-S-oxide reductase [Malassezia vespertilionis]PKI85674.1 Mxr1p [Malassezia vespertilionis]WFD05415.1 peptide-methionine (S)-S-oxide reductase [Malassezia vespertilionis]
MSTSTPASTETATFANGCFWGTEYIFRKYFGDKGLIHAEVGYIGGNHKFANPSYEQVCTGKTGHAEASLLAFDPSRVSYAELVEFFYRTHDPTQANGQGPDIGTQYRSALFPHTPEQEQTAKRVTEAVQAQHFDPKGTRIVTTIEPRPVSDLYVLFLLTQSFKAEPYHQAYLSNNPSGYHCPTHRLWW